MSPLSHIFLNGARGPGGIRNDRQYLNNFFRDVDCLSKIIVKRIPVRDYRVHEIVSARKLNDDKYRI
ncbi:MAG: hypothetical protein Ct9H300mP19_17750 [Dehalococcoidia bacterium]|nr:MAG: hypothetical protein Ct9H300mP19_17750 [Dehalococcoidia bacterium]